MELAEFKITHPHNTVHCKSSFQKIWQLYYCWGGTEICANEKGLDGDWAGVRVTGGYTKDKHVRWMLEKRICYLIPFRDIKVIDHK